MSRGKFRIQFHLTTLVVFPATLGSLLGLNLFPEKVITPSNSYKISDGQQDPPYIARQYGWPDWCYRDAFFEFGSGLYRGRLLINMLICVFLLTTITILCEFAMRKWD